MAANPRRGPYKAVILSQFQSIAMQMEEFITTGPRDPFDDGQDDGQDGLTRQQSIHFPQRLGGVEAWSGVDLRDYNLAELTEAPPIIKLSHAATRRLLSGAYRLAPAGLKNEPVDASM